jgi:hypothetical protein
MTQTGGIVRGPGRKTTAQQEALRKHLEGAANDIPAGTPDEILTDVIQAQKDELAGMLNLKELGRSDAGAALNSGIRVYDKSTRVFSDKLYDDAIRLGDDAQFNIEHAVEVASELDRGVLAKGREVTEEVVSPILDEFGKPIARDVTSSEAVKVTANPAGELGQVVDVLREIDPRISKFSVKGGEWSAFQQVKALRSRLFDLTQSDDRAVARESTKLWTALTQSLENPVSANPAFTKAWSNANAFYWVKSHNLQMAHVMRVLKTDAPSDIAATYFQPRNAAKLALMRDMMTSPGSGPNGKILWDEFRKGFQFELSSMSSPQMAINRMEAFRQFDPDGFSILMERNEYRDMLRYLTTKRKYESGPAQQQLSRVMDKAEAFVSMAREGTVGEVGQNIRLAGGLSSDYAQAARAGVFKDILDQSSGINKQGIRVIDTRRLADAIEEWQKSGKLDVLFSKAEQHRMLDVQSYASIVNIQPDMGGSLIAAQVRAKGVRTPLDLARGKTEAGFALAHTILANDWAAWIFTRNVKLGRYFGEKGLPLREATIAISIVGRDLERQQTGRTNDNTR